MGQPSRHTYHQSAKCCPQRGWCWRSSAKRTAGRNTVPAKGSGSLSYPCKTARRDPQACRSWLPLTIFNASDRTAYRQLTARA